MKLANLAATAAATIALAGCANEYDNRAPSLSVTPNPVAAGGTITLRGTALDDLGADRLAELRSASMTMYLLPGSGQWSSVKKPQVADDGSFTEKIVVPRDAAPGKWTISWDVPCRDTNFASCAGVTTTFVVSS